MRNDSENWIGVRPEGVWWLLLERTQVRRSGCQSEGNISEKRDLRKIEIQKDEENEEDKTEYPRDGSIRAINSTINEITLSRETWRGVTTPARALQAYIQLWLLI